MTDLSFAIGALVLVCAIEAIVIVLLARSNGQQANLTSAWNERLMRAVIAKHASEYNLMDRAAKPAARRGGPSPLAAPPDPSDEDMRARIEQAWALTETPEPPLMPAGFDGMS